MIDYDIEQVFIDLLGQTISSPAILHGMEPDSPELTLPAIVVTARLEAPVIAREMLYTYRISVEYKSIPGKLVSATVQSVMATIETALSSTPGTIPASVSNFSFFAYHGISNAEHRIDQERRHNIREFVVTVQQSSNLE